MQVILKEDVNDLGEKGKVVNVASGFARNFLFPRKLAIPVNKSTIKAHETEKKDLDKKNKRTRRVAEEKAEALGKKKVKITAKAGEEGKLYGSITHQDVADAIKAQTGYDVDKRKLQMPDHIKHLGAYKAEFKIHPLVTAVINFEVVEEN